MLYRGSAKFPAGTVTFSSNERVEAIEVCVWNYCDEAAGINCIA
jgi:hypothetical protein